MLNRVLISGIGKEMSMSAEIMRLPAVLKKIPIELEHEGGVIKSYTLKELTGEERDTYLDSMKNRFKYSPDGNVSAVTNFKGLHNSLLKMCLFDEETSKLITEDELQKLPSTTTTALFDEATKLSALDKEAKKEAKND